jgi:FkbM family methyltransferase
LTTSPQKAAAGALPAALRLMVALPWSVKEALYQNPTVWRWYTGLCRRLGWNQSQLGWYTAKNGPYAGISLKARHVNQLWVAAGLYEPGLTHWLVRLLTEPEWGCVGRDVWDIGAHTGTVSLVCAKHTSGNVVCFEPNASNQVLMAEHFQANPALAPRLRIAPYAVADEDGQIELVGGEASSEYQIVSEAVELWKSRAGELRSMIVQTTRLDSFLEREARAAPGLLKIDIEGAETLALKGAGALLRLHRPLVLLEVHNRQASHDCIELLTDAGYTVSQIEGKRLHPLRRALPDYGHLLAVAARPLESGTASAG